MIYNSFKYIYPPRPENAISPDDLDFWDNGSLTAQVKTNGTNCLIFTNGVTTRIMGRHKQLLTNCNLDINELVNSLYIPLNITGWLVINGELLNKSKLDENVITFNQKFIIFDILVYDSKYLVGSTFEWRIELLNRLYSEIESDKSYLYQISDNIYHVKSFDSGFTKLFTDLTKIDMIEGLVLKRKTAKLEAAWSEKNNHRSQLKCRKKEKNYKY